MPHKVTNRYKADKSIGHLIYHATHFKWHGTKMTSSWAAMAYADFANNLRYKAIVVCLLTQPIYGRGKV